LVLTLTQAEIADMIAASRETVSRLFTNFKEEGFIEVHGSTIVVSNREALQKLLEV
jgi:CRP-like cAMP-binding protein